MGTGHNPWAFVTFVAGPQSRRVEDHKILALKKSGTTPGSDVGCMIWVGYQLPRTWQGRWGLPLKFIAMIRYNKVHSHTWGALYSCLSARPGIKNLRTVVRI
jgi:hypothetical protein